MNSIVYCKTFFLPEDFVAFQFASIEMDVHDTLRPGMVRVVGAAVEKEFAQFVFSLLLEILDACLVCNSSSSFIFMKQSFIVFSSFSLFYSTGT